MSGQIKLKREGAIESVCPCGQPILVGELAEEHEGQPAGTPVCIHNKPTCEPYDRLELVPYLEWVNDVHAKLLDLPPIDRSKPLPDEEPENLLN